MRLIWVLLLFLICAGSSPAQVPSNNIAPPDVEILKYKWSKGSSRDSRLQPRPFMDASTPSPSGPIFDRNQDSQTPLRTQTQSSSGGFYSGGRRVRYVYSLKIKNNGAKTIKAIEWEHVFLDPDN